MKNYIWVGEVSQRSKSFNTQETNIDTINYTLKKYKESKIDGIIFNANNSLWKNVLDASLDIGLEFHIWKPIMRCQDKLIEEKHSDWFAVSKSGYSVLEKRPYVDYYKWFCPNNSEVKNYLLNLIDSYTEDCRISSMHLDYIRYNDLYLPEALVGNYEIEHGKYYPEYDFCYCEKCRSKFKKIYNVDPMKELTPDQETLWNNFRLDSVTNLVAKITDHLRKRGVKITAAVFPGPSIAKNNVFQDWSSWDLDAFFPMNYNNFYNKTSEWLKDVVKEERDSVGSNKKIYSGIYLDKITPEDLKKSVKNSIEYGANGVALYSDDLITDELLLALKEISSTYK